jgi:DNA-binding LacI/PurR family transcriptional regulator
MADTIAGTNKAGQCAARLLTRIKRGYKPGDRLPTQSALAHQYGVGLGTMWRALDLLRHQGWIHRTRGGGTFVARGHPIGRGTIGFLTTQPREFYLESEWLRGFYAGLSLEAALHGRTIRLLECRRDHAGIRPEEVKHILDQVDLGELDALITFWVLDASLLEPIAEHMPVVAVEFISSLERISCVDYDQAGAVRQAVEHLVDLGHKRIGFLGPSYVWLETEGYSPRYEHYVQMLRTHGLRCNNAWTVDARTYREVALTLDALLAMPISDRPTALLTQAATWPTLHELVRRGLEVGCDMSVIGLEHLPSWQVWLTENRRLQGHPWAVSAPEVLSVDPATGLGRIVQALVPTVTQLDVVGLGQAAVRETERRWLDPTSPPRRTLLPVRLDMGNTTGPPRD